MSLMTAEKLQAILEAALMVAGRPLTVTMLQNLFNEDERPDAADIKAALANINELYKDRGVELHEVASGYRLQAKTELSPWLAKLWEERPARYSRAFLETLAIIAYKQPITRAEIEEIRGVTVSTHIMKTLSEREWIRLVGFRETPGKPALYATTKTFLDHFNLSSLSELPSLAEFKDIQTQEAELQVQLALEGSNIGPDNSENIPEEREAIIQDDQPAAAVQEAAADTVIQMSESAEATGTEENVALIEAMTETIVETDEAESESAAGTVVAMHEAAASSSGSEEEYEDVDLDEVELAVSKG